MARNELLVATLSAIAVALTGCGPLADGSFTSLYDGYFQECLRCHTADGENRTSDTEKTLDFASRASAYTSITTGSASGLVGIQEGCNGASFVGSSVTTSLIVAVLDEDVRETFDDPGHADCDQTSISDMTLKVGSPPDAAFLADLKAWIEAGTPDD